MDQELKTLTDSLKKLLSRLKPQNNTLSLLIITGKSNQGISSLLKQSTFSNQAIEEDTARVFYNNHGVIVNLSEAWLTENNYSLTSVIKKINTCNRHLRINGIIFCVDINELIQENPSDIRQFIQEGNKLLAQIGDCFHNKSNLALLFTKLDLLAGFCDFFQSEHALDIQKPWGFSLGMHNIKQKAPNNFNSQFDNFIEDLNQQIISKVHTIRSTSKRTLIREFPLQIASLRATITSIIKNINPRKYNLRTIYFTSSQQGGLSIDRLNKKIKQEYALTLQEKYHHSKNHRAYFIEGALQEFQKQTKQYTTKKFSTGHKTAISVIAGVSIISLGLIINHHLNTARVLDKVSKELIAFDTLGENESAKELATYHLAAAYKDLNAIPNSSLNLQNVKKLKSSLSDSIQQQLTSDFLPATLAEIEGAVINSNQPPQNKYQALKVYIMLNDNKYADNKEISAWFKNFWLNKYSQKLTEKKLDLLQKILINKTKIHTKQQIITDARNYLNSLPTTYLYYTLAKEYFPKQNNKLAYDGFVIGSDKVPQHLSKDGFVLTMQLLPGVVNQFQAENWVLARQDLKDLDILLQQAYCYEYVIFWQNFIQKTHPIHAQSYDDAHTLTKLLRETNIIKNLVSLIQNETSPIADSSNAASIFNKEIASKFSEINLVSDSGVQQLVQTLAELEKFLGTMSVVNDHGKTAFNIAKSRFQSDDLANPVSSLYSQAKQLPKPISSWTKQIADDVWFALINNSRDYVNYQWQQQVVPEYRSRIANRYPFSNNDREEISLYDFNKFFAKNGTLNGFINDYLKPFLDTSQAKWQLKQVDSYVLPISSDSINELIRANVITNMFFTNSGEQSQVAFSLQKISLDPAVASLQLKIGGNKMFNSQEADDRVTEFSWPDPNARLVLNSMDGNQYELEELGTWALFKILQKVNVLVDEQDSSNMQILFEINGNSGRYLLKAESPVNPFIPGILNEFSLPEAIA